MIKYRFLIILFYYNRPNLVKNALISLKNSSYKDWELAFIDDGSEVDGESIVKDIFKDVSNIKFYKSYDTIENKLKRNGYNGSNMGKYAQESLECSNADYCIMLCDDDMLIYDYIENLNKFYNKNTNLNYSYCHIKVYNPYNVIPIEPFEKENYAQNITYPTCPYYKLDMSQISFNITQVLEFGIKFPYPHTVNIDAELFLQMYAKWGDVTFNGIDGQYKAIFDDNLMRRAGQVVGLIESDEYVYRIKLK